MKHNAGIEPFTTPSKVKGARPYALPLRGGRKDGLHEILANYVPFFIKINTYNDNN